MTVLHVVFGTVALVVAPAAMLARKGGAWHRRCGSASSLAMGVVLFSAGFLWQAKGHLFLVPLGAVSAYLIFSGWRAVARNRRRLPTKSRIGSTCSRAGRDPAGRASPTSEDGGDALLLLSIRPALLGIGSDRDRFRA